MRYELLQEGALREKLEEVILKSFHEGDIKPHEMVHNIMPVIKHHLETTNKPKVRLEELGTLIRKLSAETNAADLDKFYNDIAKSICTHLGLELEEKEEWERALDKIVDSPATEREQIIAQKMFEAGQAFEKARGKT